MGLGERCRELAPKDHAWTRALASVRMLVSTGGRLGWRERFSMCSVGRPMLNPSRAERSG